MNRSSASATQSDRDAERDREHASLLGRTVDGKYAITRMIGRGGMGAVYEAEHVGIGKKVALKFVDREWAKDDTVASRFAREARAASSIDSDHIVTVFDAGMDEGRPYLVMELLRGEDLGTRLRRLTRVPVEDAAHVVAQVLRGLACAHAVGIVHRDLKPDNVFLTHRGDDPLFAKIVDFGISKFAATKSGTTPLALTQKGIVLGTPLYMSPEQAQAFADLDARADLYSVGAILFECLSGRPPHTGETYEQVIVAICIRDAPDLRAIVPDVPDAVAAFVARALARDRNARFQSAQAMLEGLRTIAPSDPMTRALTMPAHTVVSGIDASAATEAAPVVSGVYGARVGAATDVSWTAGAHGTPIARGESAEYRVPSRGPKVAIAITAAFAMGAGIAVTLAILGATNPSTTVDHAPPQMSSAAAKPASPAAAASASTATPTPSATAPSSSFATPTPTPPTTTAATATAPANARAKPPPPPPVKPPPKLELQRDVP